jgi:predicted polyphosphate/ATP-dependent NAD kinase
MRLVGFLINPISGMGGSVGLKGTDGEDILERAIELGAKPGAEERGMKALAAIKGREIDFGFVTCSGSMGEGAFKKAGIPPDKYKVVYEAGSKTTSEDTRNACAGFLEQNVDIIVFCGGDGTARDIFEVIGQKKPVIGVPTGVKMHSAVFGADPKAAAEVVLEFMAGNLETKESEIMDTDEEKYRTGRLAVKLVGYAITPYRKSLVQVGKGVYEGPDEDVSKKAIAEYVAELMLNSDDTFILGPGTTTRTIARELGIEKTLLGVDVVGMAGLEVKDANESALLELLKGENIVNIIVSPIGAQGFIFGRGNQQISADVIRGVGLENVIVVATPFKLSRTEFLRVDTGDEELDRMFGEFIKVISGYHEMKIVRIGVPPKEDED